MSTPEEQIVRAVFAGIEASIDMLVRLGHRDAVLTALDGLVVAFRAKTDRDLAEKHRRAPEAALVPRRADPTVPVRVDTRAKTDPPEG